MLDLVIRNGDVIDGTGATRRRADVGVSSGRIVAIGDVSDEAHSTIDAAGKVVSPGFIDVHTHYDAQVFWDGALTPSPFHGVTTVMAGNCGFTIAPLSNNPDDGDYLMRMLARVEGMPLDSLKTGVPWGSWHSTAEYLDAVDGRLAINAGFMVGHSAVRRTVMGDQSTSRVATTDEVSAMQRLVADGLSAGAIGFSSSWARTHNDADGHMVPSRCASREEVLALCRVVRNHPGTSLEFIPMIGPEFDPWAVELMAEMSLAAQRPLNWNLLVATAANRDQCRGKLEAGDGARRAGAKVVALVVPMNVGLRLSVASGFILDAIPGWEETMLLPRSEKLARFNDDEFCAHLGELAHRPDNPVRAVANWSTQVIFDTVAPENEQYRGLSIGQIAKDQGRSAWEALCDILRADELLTSFGTPAPIESDDDWKARVEVFRDSRALVGGSDAGAHLDLLATFNYSTYLLGNGVRKAGALPLEEAVHLITDRPAQLYGLRERGRIAHGWHADLVVFDPQTIATRDVAMRFDLPGGAGRLYAEADGIDHVLVSGTPVVSHGRLTNASPGRVMRSGVDTLTPSLVG